MNDLIHPILYTLSRYKNTALEQNQIKENSQDGKNIKKISDNVKNFSRFKIIQPSHRKLGKDFSRYGQTLKLIFANPKPFEIYR